MVKLWDIQAGNGNGKELCIVSHSVLHSLNCCPCQIKVYCIVLFLNVLVYVPKARCLKVHWKFDGWELWRWYEFDNRWCADVAMMTLVLMQTWMSVRRRTDVNTIVSIQSAASAVLVHLDTDSLRTTEHVKVSGPRWLMIMSWVSEWVCRV